MSLVASADYLVSLKDGYLLDDIKTQESFRDRFLKFFLEQEIVIDKKTKTSEKAVDIRPMISFVAFADEEYKDKRSQTLKGNPYDITEVDSDSMKPASVADIYNNGIKIYMQLDTGSSTNLKPELVMEAFYDYLDIEFNKFAWQVHRLEIYTRDEADKLIPLDQLER
jgi:hypothetical protein